MSAKDAAVRLTVGGSCGARARGIMLSSTGTHTCVAAAPPRLPKRKNDQRAPVVGLVLARVDVLGLRTHITRRRYFSRKEAVSQGQMVQVRTQTNGPILSQKVAGVAGLLALARTHQM